MPSARHHVPDAWAGVADLPLPVRFAIVAGSVLGILGGIVGLIVGLVAHPPTAWFAVIEVGLPAGLLGALLGLVVGAAAYVVRRVRSH